MFEKSRGHIGLSVTRIIEERDRQSGADDIKISKSRSAQLLEEIVEKATTERHGDQVTKHNAHQSWRR